MSIQNHYPFSNTNSSILKRTGEEGQESQSKIQKLVKSTIIQDFHHKHLDQTFLKEIDQHGALNDVSISNIFAPLEPSKIISKIDYQWPRKKIIEGARQNVEEELELYEELTQSPFITNQHRLEILTRELKEATTQLEWLKNQLEEDPDDNDLNDLLSEKLIQYIQFCQLRPTLYNDYMNLVKTYGPSLSICTHHLSQEFASHFTSSFPNLKTLAVINELDDQSIEAYIPPSLVSFKLEPSPINNEMNLAHFENAKMNLDSIELLGLYPEEIEESSKGEKNEDIHYRPCYRVQPFQNPDQMQTLTQLTLNRAICQKGLLSNLANIPNLAYLNLKESALEDIKELEILCQKHPKLIINLKYTVYLKTPLTAEDNEFDEASLPLWVISQLKHRYPQLSIFSEHGSEFADWQQDQTSFKNILYSAEPSTPMHALTELEAINLLNDMEAVHSLFSFQQSYYHPLLVRAPSCFAYDQNNFNEQLGSFFSASPIKLLSPRPLIATHAPLHSEKSSTIKDFWNAVVKLNTNLIVMLTSCEEVNPKNGKTTVMSPAYWPQEIDAPITFQCDGFQLTITLKQEDSIYTSNTKNAEKMGFKRIFHLYNEQQKVDKKVTQIQITEWPDGTALGPAKTDWLNYTICHEEQKNIDGSTLVHCAAGVGRTGTFLMSRLSMEAFTLFLKDKNPEELKKLAPHLQFDIRRALIGLRQQRMNLVYGPNQLLAVDNYFKNKKAQLLRKLENTT